MQIGFTNAELSIIPVLYSITLCSNCSCVSITSLYIYSGYFVLLSCIIVAVTLYVCRNMSKNAEKNNKSHQKIKEDG